MRLETLAVRWGRSAGARCVTRRQRASAACVRQVGCATEWCSPPQAAMLGTTARVSTLSRVRPCVFMLLPTAHCRPTTSVGCRGEALLVPTVHAGRACAALNRRSAACSTLPPAVPSAAAIADGGTDGKITISCTSACTRKSLSRVLAERAQPHSSALASTGRVPSLVGNGPHRLVLRRRRYLLRRSVRRDWQRLRRGLRTQHAARW
jgi:hypothetical protein